MAKAIFTTSESSAYDDQPEVRYHFPKTYLRQAEAALGDLILYYEPRRTQGPRSTTGRQAYFAVARLQRVERDEATPDHSYAYVEDYLEFDRPVPFREGDLYYESALRKPDGSTNKGAFGRAVRNLDEAEFEAILRAGFTRELEPWERLVSGVAEPAITYAERPIVTQVVSRPFRDEAFRRHVREAYDNTCAVSGLRLINGGGRPEVQAAHIQPVARHGPDSVRNGLALTGTVHWLFDRGLISVDDDHRLLVARGGLPEGMGGLLQPHRPLRLPRRQEWWPHASYLKFHREHVFKGQ
ncbi:HNH endonuclease family protein [Cystobacter fuscus DSM 2262]|uniref:HNH endonuclease family protein n=1 Tax=Cystobacter fuscus (strain ATCC 25194 / DSM 2262 / NBRC 100088 / M29) TaxID=1242864 RepID=S9P449_CYSF2|nr:HNH endonuclease [Cystobacter fuscus]EPX57012.1 HNH endonuclease family protein [Cystobacter fuscus DSM 2262]